MKALSKLFFKLLEKCLEVTNRSCFTGLTSLAHICLRFPDHLLQNHVHDTLDSFFELIDHCQFSSLDLHHGIQPEEVVEGINVQAVGGPDRFFDILWLKLEPADKLQLVFHVFLCQPVDFKGVISIQLQRFPEIFKIVT